MQSTTQTLIWKRLQLRRISSLVMITTRRLTKMQERPLKVRQVRNKRRRKSVDKVSKQGKKVQMEARTKQQAHHLKQKKSQRVLSTGNHQLQRNRIKRHCHKTQHLRSKCRSPSLRNSRYLTSSRQSNLLSSSTKQSIRTSARRGIKKTICRSAMRKSTWRKLSAT